MGNQQPDADNHVDPLEERIRAAFQTSITAREKARRLKQTTDAVIAESKRALERAKILQRAPVRPTHNDNC
jgi:hypothetical protein